MKVIRHLIVANLLVTSVLWVVSVTQGRRYDMAIVPNTSVDLATHIRDVLNNAGGSVSNDTTTFFTAGAKTGKWIKYKPVNVKQDFFANITDTFMADNNPTESGKKTVPWFIGDMSSENSSVSGVKLYDVCGMKIPVEQSCNNSVCANAIDNYATNGCNWVQSLVKSGYPKRLGDFRGYDTGNNYCPFYLSAPSTVYSGEDARFGIYDNAESSSQVGMEAISQALDSSFERGVIIKFSNGSFAYYGSGTPITNGSVGADWSISLSVGTYKAYFVARSTSLNKTLLYPSESNCPNPVSFSVVNYVSPTVNPLKDLSYSIDQGGFAYDYRRTYFEPISNDDSLTVYMNTTYSFCFYIDFYAADKDVIIGFSDFSFLWGYSGTGSGEGRPPHIVYINNTNYTYSQYTFKKGTTTRVFFQFNNIFYDASSQTTNIPSEGTTFDPYYDDYPIKLCYKNSELEDLYIYITYSSSHDGYFYNSRDGYYISK